MRWTIKPISKSISNLDERVAELDSNLGDVTTYVNVAGSLTSDYVTVVACLAQYIGKLAIYFLEFIPNGTIPAGTEFISGFKVPNYTRNDVCVFEGVGVGTSTVNKFTVRDGGKLKNIDAISDTVRRRMTFMYFTV